MTENKALLLIGSPRCEKSTSLIIGDFVLDRLKEMGYTVDTLFLSRLVSSTDGRDRLIAAVNEAGIIIIAAPLYIDSLPAFVIRALESIYDDRRAKGPVKAQKLFAIVNSGFPEPHQNQAAIDIYRQFARASGIEWAGGVRVGMGGAIGGRKLEDTGGMTGSLRKGLSIAASALAKGESVPDKAIELTSKPFMPLSMARLMLAYRGKSMWEAKVTDKAVIKNMYDRPYET